MAFDFRTADNATQPHVAVYVVESERVVCTIPIVDGRIDEAEILAEVFIFALCNDTSAPRLS